MSTATTISLVTGLVALSLSIYGVWERRQDSRHRFRSQLVTVIDQLQGLDREERELERQADEQATYASRASLTTRRALLAEQAASLDAEVRGRGVGANEYLCLARAFESVGDLDAAIQYWQRSTDRADASSRRRGGGDAVPSIARAASWRGLGACHRQRGEFDRAAEAFATSLAVCPTNHPRGHLDRIQAMIDWAYDADTVTPPDGRDAMGLLADARAEAAMITEPDLHEYAVQLLATAEQQLARVRSPRAPHR